MNSIKGNIEPDEKDVAIKVCGISKYYSDVKAVDHLSFDIFKNEIFGLLGPNGAGKTTSINMICGLLKPSEGSIDFNIPNRKDQKSIIGYCPQENIFYPKLTCIEQLIYIGQLYGVNSSKLKEQAKILLSMLGLEEKSNVLAGKLSGGMKRRLNIALALIHDPEILILDEPEAGLDPQSRILVRDFIHTLANKKTIILTTHNMDEADRLSDRVAIIDHGKLLMVNTPQKLKQTIGEGDILELKFPDMDSDCVLALIPWLTDNNMAVKMSSDSLLIKHPNIMECLLDIKKQTESLGLTIDELKLRENSLEDVFIHLTGRNLRQ